jgi:hypothetical protein
MSIYIDQRAYKWHILTCLEYNSSRTGRSSSGSFPSTSKRAASLICPITTGSDPFDIKNDINSFIASIGCFIYSLLLFFRTHLLIIPFLQFNAVPSLPKNDSFCRYFKGATTRYHCGTRCTATRARWWTTTTRPIAASCRTLSSRRSSTSSTNTYYSRFYWIIVIQLESFLLLLGLSLFIVHVSVLFIGNRSRDYPSNSFPIILYSGPIMH